MPSPRHPRVASSQGPPRPTAAALGAAKETQACAYLEHQGLRLLTRNYRGADGELDLVMQHDNCLVFVEVRYRRNATFGTAAETISAQKQQRLIHAAEHYLQQHPSPLPCRFDVLALDGNNEVQWLQDAFQAG